MKAADIVEKSGLQPGFTDVQGDMYTAEFLFKLASADEAPVYRGQQIIGPLSTYEPPEGMTVVPAWNGMTFEPIERPDGKWSGIILYDAEEFSWWEVEEGNNAFMAGPKVVRA